MNVFMLRRFAAAALLACFAGAAQAQYIVTGTATTLTHVKRFDTAALAETASFFAYPGFAGGVRVAVGDVNGDGVGDIITGAGPGGAPHVKVFDGVSLAEIRSFLAYTGFTGGIFVAAGDINGDGRADIITGTDSGTAAHVKVFDANTSAELRSFLPFGGAFTAGARVAAGRVNSDGIADIVVGTGPGGASQVTVFDGVSGALVHSFFPYSGFTGGVFVASGDINGDLRDDIVTGTDAGVTAHVKAFDAASLAELRSFFPFGAFTGGARVAAGRVNLGPIADIVVGSGPGAAQVQAYDGATNALIQNFIAYTGFTGGVFVAAPRVLIPTAAEVSISGRILTPEGRGLRNANVILTDSNGISRQVRSLSFGSYRFDSVQAGETYIIGVSSKQYRFTPRPVTVSENLTDVDLIADCRKHGKVCDPASF